MAWADPVSDRQVELIESLASRIVPDYLDLSSVDDVARPVYGCDVVMMNRGQASMLIDDLLYELGESDVAPEYESIFGSRPPF